jgi:hypothetical protein
MDAFPTPMALLKREHGMDAALRIALLAGAIASLGATYKTQNFIVTAPTAEFAEQVGQAAEIYRRDLSIEWIGREMPRWSAPCPIHVTVGTMGAGGATTFNFERGEVFGWKMNIQGSEERILDSVLPHEINHTIFACYFRRPLPRWADEGAASLIEHESERMRLRKLHDQALGTRRKIPLRTLLEMKEYPSDQQQVLTLYAEGHSLAEYLIAKSSKSAYLKFLNDAHRRGWDAALKSSFGYERVEDLEAEWDKWVIAGSPMRVAPRGQELAERDGESPVVRGQSPELAVVLGQPTARPPRPASPRVAARELSRDRSRLQQPLVVRPVSARSGKAAAARQALHAKSVQ